jgi:hypothetical protein
VPNFVKNSQRLFNTEGVEINLWLSNWPHILPTLFNLPAIQKEFSSHPVDDKSTTIPGFCFEIPPNTIVYTDPIANLCKYGNFQSHGPLHVMLQYITFINQKINPRLYGFQEELIAIVTTGKMQGYGKWSNKARKTSKHYDT